MIGNDIVDLKEAKLKSNWQRPRFLEKLFTLKEQQFIHNSDNAFLMVWRLWSIKEAAYKLYTQLNPNRFYNPKQFECDINSLDSIVRYKDFQCFVTTKISTQYILSEARLVSCEIISDCIEIPNNSSKIQSSIMTSYVLNAVSNAFSIAKEHLKIVKSEFGIPQIYQNSKKINISISISHHGNYGAYAICDLVSSSAVERSLI